MKMIKEFYKKNIKIIRIIYLVIWLLLLLVFAGLFAKYRERKKLVDSYNHGNRCYELALYDFAEDYYKDAYRSHPSDSEICSIQINHALSIAKQYPPDEIDETNVADAIDRLEEAIELLVQDGCANKDDNNGHNQDAQTLKNEIQAYIDELKKQYPQDGDGQEQNSNPEEQPDNGEDEEQRKLRETFEEIQRNGMAERTQDMDWNDATKGSYEYYDGKSW